MPNTYTQIHLHVVFSVQNRQSLIAESWKERLYQYISGIIKNNGHKMLAIGGMPDHIHILFGLRPSQSLSEIMKVVKGESAKWINQNGFISGKFSWQEGYGAFSYSKSHIPAVVNYILTQEKHHKKTSFIEEYKELLEKFGIELPGTIFISKNLVWRTYGTQIMTWCVTFLPTFSPYGTIRHTKTKFFYLC